MLILYRQEKCEKFNIYRTRPNKFDTLQELYEFIFGTKYFTLTEKEKFIRRYETAFYKIKFYNLDLDIVHTIMGTLGEQYKIID